MPLVLVLYITMLMFCVNHFMLLISDIMDNTLDGLNIFTSTMVLCILITLITMLIYLITKIYYKFKGNIDPVHIFQLNIFLTMIFIGLFLFVNEVVYLLGTYFHPISCNQYYFGLFTIISLNADINIAQADRFIASFWSLHYPSFAF